MYARPTDDEGRPLTFGVSGKLWRDALVMFDRQTGSLWSQISGDAIRAELERCIGMLVDEELICETDIAGPPVEAWSSQAYEVPVVEVYSDLQDLIILDPVHEVDDAIGWPRRAPERDDA